MTGIDDSAQVLPLPDRRSVDEALAYFDSWLGFRQEFSRIPGVQAAVHAYGEVLLSTAHGLADLSSGESLTTGHLFRIASHSKTFTATAVFQLVEAGAVRLDDPASAWVSDLAGHPVGAISIRELLGHAGGVFRDSLDGDFWQLYRPFPGTEELMAMLTDDAAAVLPTQQRFKYSNVAYSLLGLIIAAAAGRPYREFVQTEIADRLGLTDTGPELLPARAADYAAGHSALSYAQSRVRIEHIDTGAMSSATGFHATACDLVTYWSAHFLGDDRLLTDRSKRAMQHPWWDSEAGGKRYALGLSVTQVGSRTMIGHGGGYPGHITSSVADARAGLAVSVLTNAIDGPAESLAHGAVKLIDLAGGADRPTVGSVDPARFTGGFASLWGVIDVALLGGRLYRLHPALPDPTEDAAELEIVDATTLRIAGGSGYGAFGELMRYTVGTDGTIERLRGESGMTLIPLADFHLTGPVSIPT